MKKIIIRKIENRQNDFIAYFKNPVLKSTYFVCFKDSIMGAVALTDFLQMLKTRYENESFNFEISEQNVSFKNEHLLNQITDSNPDLKIQTEEKEAVTI